MKVRELIASATALMLTCGTNAEYHGNLEEVYRDWGHSCLIAMGVIIAQNQQISGERIRAHVPFLSSDLLEGRGVGTRGGQLTEEYIAAQLAAWA